MIEAITKPEISASIKGKTIVVFVLTDLMKPPDDAHQKALEIAAKETNDSNKKNLPKIILYRI